MTQLGFQIMWKGVFVFVRGDDKPPKFPRNGGGVGQKVCR